MEKFLTGAKRKAADDTTAHNTSVRKSKSRKYFESY
jgi:hypothetical protein